MQNYEKYYTKNMKYIIEEIFKIKHFLPDKPVFIDSSAGDNKFIEQLLKQVIICSYISYDISPPNQYFGKVLKKDWLKETIENTENTIIGFNPPYGFGSKIAKQFIYKGFLEKHPFCIWLVPISLKLFLLKLYEPLLQKEFIHFPFMDTNRNKIIKQSVFLFVGKKRNVKNHKSIFLSRLKKKVKSKYNYILKRTHNEGIRDDTTLILKKTGNPVFFPSFYKPDISKNIWWQINKSGIVYKKATLEKHNGKFVMNGKHITKHLNTDYKYAVDSNIYVKLSYLEKWIDLLLFIKKLVIIGNTKEFYNTVNRYKPAAITIGWLRELLNKYIDNNKIEKKNIN
tara:strand:- start:809 stop:1828 length:1020 start_codon:yes stop_codon:yes gene_type:complete